MLAAPLEEETSRSCSSPSDGDVLGGRAPQCTCRMSTREIKMVKQRSPQVKRGSFACAIGLALSLAVCSQAAFAKNESKLPSCDDLKTEFHPDSLTTVLLVKAYKKGETLALSGTPATPAPPVAANDVCMVKLLVGPGHSGPAGAPSTSPGIGIEIWVWSHLNWHPYTCVGV